MPRPIDLPAFVRPALIAAAFVAGFAVAAFADPLGRAAPAESVPAIPADTRDA
jgi:hypothetical protein